MTTTKPLVFTLLLVLCATLLATGSAPQWYENPLYFTAVTTKVFHQGLARYVQAQDAERIVFEKKSGPEWLSISADGVTSGVPSYGDLGKNSSVVTASIGTTTTSGRLEIEVEEFEPSTPPNSRSLSNQ